MQAPGHRGPGVFYAVFYAYQLAGRHRWWAFGLVNPVDVAAHLATYEAEVSGAWPQ